MEGKRNMSWNRYEAALLLDTHRRIKSGLAVKKDAIKELSLRLREGMIKSGLIISDTFRNENGISLQLSAMEYCLTDGAAGIQSVSRVFSEIANLYQTSPDSYSAILDAANKVYPLVSVSIEEKPQQLAVKEEKKATEETTGASNSVQTTQSPALSLFGDDTHSGIPSQIVAEPIRRFVSSRVKDVLTKHFKAGFRLESPIDTRKYKKFYQALNGSPYPHNDAQLYEEVQSCGILYEGKVYVPELMLNDELKSDLIGYIQSKFDVGEKCVYYSVLFEQYSERFLGFQIYTEEMMRQYLEFFKGSEWHFDRKYISRFAHVVVDIETEVLNLVKANGGLMSEDEICSELHMLPQDVIKMVIVRNSNILISTGRTGQRFHIDNFQITDNEKFSIITYIKEAISKYHYITTNELMNDIRVNVPNVLDYNEVFGEIGIRNALGVILAGQFSFSGNIISSLSNRMRTADVVKSFCESHESFALDELLALYCDLSVNINLDHISELAVRVSHDKFLNPQNIKFDIEATDDVIDRLCPGEYIAFKDFELYSSLPYCGLEWNSFLLESYVAKFSRKFKLIHPRYNQDVVPGAIVKREVAINDFEDFLANIVGRSEVQLNKEAVLNFLQEKGYIARRRMSNIENLIIKARLVRNQLKTEN